MVVSWAGLNVVNEDLRFAILAEKDGDSNALVLQSLTLEKLYEHIVVPYEEGRPFFIDGVPVERKRASGGSRSSAKTMSSSGPWIACTTVSRTRKEAPGTCQSLSIRDV
jgi:hypothetical protein